MGTTFTRSNGEFEFDNVSEGSYNLTVELSGYETVTQQMQVMMGPVFGVDVEVRKTEAADEAAKGPSKISVRELSIPHKAHDAMQKGLELLYVKSDYKGSLKQFERAIQEYPGYYEHMLRWAWHIEIWRRRQFRAVLSQIPRP